MVIMCVVHITAAQVYMVSMVAKSIPMAGILLKPRRLLAIRKSRDHSDELVESDYTRTTTATSTNAVNIPAEFEWSTQGHVFGTLVISHQSTWYTV